MKFLIINGPNLNLMHFTEPGVAGQIDYNALLDYLEVCCQQMDIQVEFFQSNHEGDLIDEIQSGRRPGGRHRHQPGRLCPLQRGHSGRAAGLRRARRGGHAPATPDSHEPFRKTDIVSFGCQGHFIGEGISGYLHACAYLVQLLRIDGSGHTRTW